MARLHPKLHLQHFLKTHWDGQSPLLLGYSGGPDSKALLYLLLELGISPSIAHVDHGWRAESRAEAEALRGEVESLGLVFHTTRLHEVEQTEVAAREARLQFFQALFQKKNFQALLLAHQGDDLAETVLKRTLEGAHLVHLGGMREMAVLEGLPVWRPLLKVPRRDLEKYLSEKNLSAIDDATNRDPAYLRARMRVEILPELAASFGKEVSTNLVWLSERTHELKEYLDQRTEEALQQIQRTPWGWAMPPVLEERIEIRHALLRTGISWTRVVLEPIVEAIASRKPRCRFGADKFVHKGWFFCLSTASKSKPSKTLSSERKTI